MKGAYFTRWLYDFEKPLLLVTSVAQCKGPERHRSLDMTHVCQSNFQMKRISHSCCFTDLDLLKECSILSSVKCPVGVKFHVTQGTLRNNYFKSHTEKKVAYLTALSSFNDEHPEMKSWKPFPDLKIKGPRESFISQCLILSF